MVVPNEEEINKRGEIRVERRFAPLEILTSRCTQWGFQHRFL
jgi:hypothetical protein